MLCRQQTSSGNPANPSMPSFRHPGAARVPGPTGNCCTLAIEGLEGDHLHDLCRGALSGHVSSTQRGTGPAGGSNDIIVFQHPFYWYSCPAIMKEWMDLVLGTATPTALKPTPSAASGGSLPSPRGLPNPIAALASNQRPAAGLSAAVPADRTAVRHDLAATLRAALLPQDP